MSGRWQVGVSHSDDVDDITLERILRGESPRRVTRGERLAAVTTLTARGRSLAQIATLLRVAPYTVTRYRAMARSESQ